MHQHCKMQESRVIQRLKYRTKFPTCKFNCKTQLLDFKINQTKSFKGNLVPTKATPCIFFYRFRTNLDIEQAAVYLFNFHSNFSSWPTFLLKLQVDATIFLSFCADILESNNRSVHVSECNKRNRTKTEIISCSTLTCSFWLTNLSRQHNRHSLKF